MIGLSARRLARSGAAALIAAALIAPFLAEAPRPAQAQSWSNQRDEAAILQRLDVLEAEIRSLRAELGRGRSGGEAAPAGSGGVFLRLGAIEDELRRLTGTVERLRFRTDEIARDAARRFGDIEYRLTELEGGDTSILPPEPLPLGGGAATGAPAAQVSVSERGDLESAIRLVQQGRLEDAEDGLTRFLRQYPNSPLGPEAHYWLGEARFTRGAFREAARDYLQGFNAAPGGEQAADNLLKLGVTLGRLGQTQEACLTLREVASRFPGRERAVAEANGEAQRLSCG